MQHLYQKFETDCFPTCIAMVSGISHKWALFLTHPLRRKGEPYTTTDPRGVEVLRLLGFRVRKRYVKNFTKLKQPAILSLHFPNEKTGHVAVWDPEQKKVLEPYRSYHSVTNKQYQKALEYVWILSR